MKTIAALFTAMAFLLAPGMASAAEEGAPWNEKDLPPLIKSKPEDAKKKDQKKDKKKDKKEKEKEKKKKAKAKKKENGK